MLAISEIQITYVKSNIHFTKRLEERSVSQMGVTVTETVTDCGQDRVGSGRIHPPKLYRFEVEALVIVFWLH